MDEVASPSSREAPIGWTISPTEAMRWALREARKGTGRVSPNPLVGCAIVDRQNRLLAVGHHARLGGDHAEINALKKVSETSRLEGAHWYVTLEPCAHQGRTPSCAKTLVPLAPGSVTYALKDPNPLVSGKGAEILSAAEIKTRLFSERQDVSAEDRARVTSAAEDLAEIFLHGQREKEPFVAVKIASTLDGQMATKDGESKWITGERARLHAHMIRARYDAVLIGSGTFLSDDPSLNVRHPRFESLENKIVLLDPDGRCLARLAKSNLLKVRRPENLIVAVAPGIAARGDWRTLQVKQTKSGFAMSELLAGLKDAGVHSLMVEGGAATIGAFFTAGKVQRLHAYLAPLLLGGANGLGWSSAFGAASLKKSFRIEGGRRKRLGSDLYWTGRISR